MELIGRRLLDDELRVVLDDPSSVDALLYGDDDAEMPEPELDLGKSWHALHYLLTGTAWDLGGDATGAAILGGDEVGPDGGYGPARVLKPDLVRIVAAALETVDAEALRARFDVDAIAAAKIYPNVWTYGVADVDGLIEGFARLRQFYRRAAANGEAVVLVIT